METVTLADIRVPLTSEMSMNVVMRGGQEVMMSSALMVEGDIVKLRIGDVLHCKAECVT